MELRIKLKPHQTIKRQTRRSAESAIAENGYIKTYNGKETYYTAPRGGDRYAVHFERQRRKYKQTKVYPGRTESTLVRDGGWTIHVYKIPREWPFLVNQKTRHFDIVGV